MPLAVRYGLFEEMKLQFIKRDFISNTDLAGR